MMIGQALFLYLFELNEHVYSHRGNIKTVKNKITIKEKKRKKNTNKNEIMK